MNVFPRNSRYLNHTISGLASRCVCAECGASFLWACGVDTETLTCSKDHSHSGLIENKDALAMDFVRNHKNDLAIQEILADPSTDKIILAAVRQRRMSALSALYGDDDA